MSTCKLLLLPLPMAAPEPPLPSKVLLMLVTADTPVAVDVPLKALAKSLVDWLAEVSLVADVPLPEAPLPEAPPAASTLPVEAAALLLPV